MSFNSNTLPKTIGIKKNKNNELGININYYGSNDDQIHYISSALKEYYSL